MKLRLRIIATRLECALLDDRTGSVPVAHLSAQADVARRRADEDRPRGFENDPVMPRDRPVRQIAPVDPQLDAPRLTRPQLDAREPTSFCTAMSTPGGGFRGAPR
jgi:hypothetical protein